MTLVLSLYTSEGIIFAADRQIVARPLQGGPDVRQPQQRKLFTVGGVGTASEGALLGYFGLAQIAGKPMTDWLRRVIDRWPGSREVAEFALYLCDELNNSPRTNSERRQASGFHLGGFEQREGRKLPVFYFILNTSGFDVRTGLHSNVGPYRAEAHFPDPYAQTVLKVAAADARRGLRQHQKQNGFPFWLRNGDLQFASETLASVESAVARLVGVKGFELPRELAGWEGLARVCVELSRDIYRVVQQCGVPLIGGRIDVSSVSWPS